MEQAISREDVELGSISPEDIYEYADFLCKAAILTYDDEKDEED